jgi:hypothetical protein
MKTLRLNVLSCPCCVGGKGCLASTQYSQGRRDIREKQEKFKNKKQDELSINQSVHFNHQNYNFKG